MSIDTSELLSLPARDKLRLVELLWKNLEESTETPPWPSWIAEVARDRLSELRQNPTVGLSHDEIWQQIATHAQ